MTVRIPSDTNPVRQLIDEHEIFMDALEKLSGELATVPDDASCLPTSVLDVVRQSWRAINEHLNVHFVKEEEIFFPYIERMFPNARVKFQFLHVDHDKLRDEFEIFTAALQDHSVRELRPWNAASLKATAREMIRLLYYHIVAEDTIYLDIAERSMAPDEAATVLQNMRLLEDRLRERHLSLPERKERTQG